MQTEGQCGDGYLHGQHTSLDLPKGDPADVPSHQPKLSSAPWPMPRDLGEPAPPQPDRWQRRPKKRSLP